MNIENKKQFAIIVLAVGVGVVAAVMTGQYIQTTLQEENKRRAKEFEDKQMKPLKMELQSLRQQIADVASRPVPQGGAGGGAVASVAKSSLSLMTPSGKRAYTVRIEPLKAVGGMINPGDYVDIMGHINIPDPGNSNKPEPVSTMLFQNVKVLAVGTNLQTSGGYDQQQAAGALNVTFGLTPQEASLMSFVERNGQMQLVLRPPAETQVESMQKADWQNLADYIFNKQGTEIATPLSQSKLKPDSDQKKEEAKPYLEIFKAGQQQ